MDQVTMMETIQRIQSILPRWMRIDVLRLGDSFILLEREEKESQVARDAASHDS